MDVLEDFFKQELNKPDSGLVSWTSVDASGRFIKHRRSRNRQATEHRDEDGAAGVIIKKREKTDVELVLEWTS